MKTKSAFWLFIMLAFIQLSVPGYMIAKHEFALHKGTQFKFEIAPVDPVDAFRGRYLAIRIKNNYVTVDQPTQFQRGEQVYVSLTKEDGGWVQITELRSKHPPTGDYLEVKVNYIRPDQNRVYLDLPFDRYYLPEQIAPQVEEKYRQLSRSDSRQAYITVRVKAGLGVIEELYLAGQPVSEYKQDN